MCSQATKPHRPPKATANEYKGHSPIGHDMNLDSVRVLIRALTPMTTNGCSSANLWSSKSAGKPTKSETTRPTSKAKPATTTSAENNPYQSAMRPCIARKTKGQSSGANKPAAAPANNADLSLPDYQEDSAAPGATWTPSGCLAVANAVTASARPALWAPYCIAAGRACSCRKRKASEKQRVMQIMGELSFVGNQVARSVANEQGIDDADRKRLTRTAARTYLETRRKTSR